MVDRQSRSEKAHFVGVAGAGMSALAQFHVMGGGMATGSDRAFDRGGAQELRRKLESLGVTIFPQDGSGLSDAPSRVAASTAVEEDNPDLARAKTLGIPIVHRADWLARYVDSFRTIAVAGTSGKSTVVAMIYEILEAAGLSPSVITGGALLLLEKKGCVGNAFRGRSDLLVVEADESDGTLLKYRPWLGVLLNVSKDHKELSELRELFRGFRRNCRAFAIRAGDPDLAEFEGGSSTFGIGSGTVQARDLQLSPAGSRFTISGVPFDLPVPGRHNVENALAAVAACAAAGVDAAAAAGALRRFQGVARRLQRIGVGRGIEVIDDFAHNPAKVAAALDAVHLRAARVHAVFQLHGYAPARFLRNEFVETFASKLGSEDCLWMPEIYYAGGTASKTISAEDIARAISARGRRARFFADRAAIVADLAKEARSGDVVLVMGARDPSLPDFARSILAALSA